MNSFKLVDIGQYFGETCGTEVNSSPSILFYVRGIIRRNITMPGGWQIAKDDCTTPSFLSIGIPGIEYDFEYSVQRENWVVFLKDNLFRYSPAKKTCYLCTEAGDFEVPFRIFLNPDETEKMLALFKRCQALHENGSPRNLFLAELLIQDVIGQFMAAQKTGAAENDPAGRLKQLIDDDKTWAYSIQEHCREIGMCRDRIRNLFQQRYKISPGQYRIRRRIKSILHQIAFSHDSLKEIANDNGIRNISHLNMLLRSYCDATPTAICKKYRGKKIVIPLPRVHTGQRNKSEKPA